MCGKKRCLAQGSEGKVCHLHNGVMVGAGMLCSMACSIQEVVAWHEVCLDYIYYCMFLFGEGKRLLYVFIMYVW